ncbi:MAG: hypothetical protein M3R66_16705 [Actinomycetota bacterium]|nr:hypothetical protein [Actinomycetota bacterium]
MVAEHGRGHDAAAETVRVEGARILATLIRTVGDVQMAEDAVQEATLAALCPVTGVPPQPRAWLTVTARRKAIDILRRERARPGKERDGLRMIELARSDPDHTSEVEVVFIAETPRRTRLELEHRHIDRHGPGWLALSQGVGGDAGWPLYLARYATLLTVDS